MDSPLPTAPAHTTPVSAATAPQDTILVIDDDPRDIRLLAEMLHPEGYRLFAALGGEEGFKRALEAPPALVLLDMNMPGMDGRATCHLFKSAPQLSVVPIIFLTGSGLLDDKLAAFALGAVDYITKPFSAEEVAARMRVHLRLQRQRMASPPQETQAMQAPAAAEAAEAVEAVEAARSIWQDPGERVVRDAQGLLLRDLAASPTLVDLAHAVGTNERRLTDEFRRHTGMAVFEYLRHERYRRARELLLHSGLSVNSIANAVGFHSVPAFSSAFRLQYGLTPSQYRQSAGLGPLPDAC